MKRSLPVLVTCVALPLTTGCLSGVPAPGGGVGEVFEGDAGIVGLTLSCDSVDAQWELRVRTDAWSAGTKLWMTRDGVVVEKHSGSSIEAAADGQEDCLEASITQATDPSDAGNGASRWLCEDAAELSYLVYVTDTTGETVTDCRVWGARPGVWSGVSGAPECGIALDDGPDTGAMVGDEGDLGTCEF
jgi:hypothetical protein